MTKETTKTSNEKAKYKTQKRSAIVDYARNNDNFEIEQISETHNEDLDDEHKINDFSSDSDENEFIDETVSSQNETHEDFEEGQELEHSKKLSKSYDIEVKRNFTTF